MRRPAIACRRAAPPIASPPLQHIWIPDSLLSRTLDHFFRSGCAHQRRYGSNVPGPLEARRRATRRRMTAQSHAAPPGGVPPPFSFGALFGARTSPQPSWRYEPPSSPQYLEQLTPSFQNSSAILDTLHKLPPEPPGAIREDTQAERWLSEVPSEPLPIKVQNEVSVIEKDHDAVTSITPTAKSADSAHGGKARTTQPKSKKRHKIHTLMKRQEQVAEKDIQVQVMPEELTDLARCVTRFKMKVRIVESLPDSKCFDFLCRAIRSYCPTGKQAGDFALFVLHHLRRTDLSPNTIVACLAASKVPLPDLGAPRGLEFVRQLNEMAKSSAKIIRRMDRLYENLAATVITSPKRETRLWDEGIRMLYRAIWEYALRSQKHDQEFEPSTIRTLNGLGKRFSNPRLDSHLKRILNDRAHTADQIDRLVRSSSGRRRGAIVGALVLDCIPRELLSTSITSFPRYLVKRVDRRHERQRHRHLEAWLRVLQVLDTRIATAPENTATLDLALKSLIADGVDLVIVSRVLMYMRPELLVKALLHRLPFQMSTYGIPSKKKEEFVRLHRISLKKDENSLVSRNEMLARFLARMKQQTLPNQEMVNLVVQLIYKHKGVQSVFDMLRRLKRKGVVLSDTDFLYQFLSKSSPGPKETRVSTSTYQHDDASTLHACQSIRGLQLEEDVTEHELDKLLVSRQSRRQFEHILNNARRAHLLPLAYKNMEVDALMSIQVELIHQIAYQYSLARTRTSQQNGRSIYYLYKYLHNNQLPIGPLFTQAVMRVCIVQPLLEKRFVSARRLTWVCQMMAPVEGVDVAKKIEHIFNAWRGDLIQHAKRTLYASGGTGKAHVNTMRKLGLL